MYGYETLCKCLRTGTYVEYLIIRIVLIIKLKRDNNIWIKIRVWLILISSRLYIISKLLRYIDTYERTSVMDFK